MNHVPLYPITAADRAIYQRDGVVCLRGMFDAQWIARMCAAVDTAMDAEHALARRREVTRALGGKSGRYHINTFVWPWNEDFRHWVLDSPCAAIAASIMGVGEVRVFYDQVFVKEPNTLERTDWHHDLPFWPLRGNDIASVWVALTDVGPENSQLEYIAGSHNWGKFYAAAVPDKDAHFKSDLEPCPDFSRLRDDPTLKFLRWEMRAGDCLVHHPLVVHGSDGNFSLQKRRVAISTRYFGADVRWDPRPATFAVTGDPQIAPGAYPLDDRVFPVAWRRDAKEALAAT